MPSWVNKASADNWGTRTISTYLYILHICKTAISDVQKPFAVFPRYISVWLITDSRLRCETFCGRALRGSAAVGVWGSGSKWALCSNRCNPGLMDLNRTLIETDINVSHGIQNNKNSLVKSHNTQSNRMHSVVFRYSVLQYLLINPTCFGPSWDRRQAFV